MTVLLRHPHQADAARACGAARVVMGSGAAAFEELAALTGGRSVGDGDDRMLMGGFAYVIEAAGGPGAVTTRCGPPTTGAPCSPWVRRESARST